jgi:hypothetical protein
MDNSTQGIWVNSADGAQITGFTEVYLEILGQQQIALPENQRSIKLRQRNDKIEFWMPDLVKHMTQRRASTTDK